MDSFTASEKKRYRVCYLQKNSLDNYVVHVETHDIESAEEERKIMLDAAEFNDMDIRIMEEITKVNWYSYS